MEVVPDGVEGLGQPVAGARWRGDRKVDQMAAGGIGPIWYPILPIWHPTPFWYQIPPSGTHTLSGVPSQMWVPYINESPKWNSSFLDNLTSDG